MLLNIVRSRYLDDPFFLSAGAVTATYGFAQSAGGSLGFVSAVPPAINTLGLTAEVERTEAPTVSYVPLTGQAYADLLLGPIPIEALALLSVSGWELERVIRLGTSRLNMLSSGGATTTSQGSERQDARFARAAALLGQLRRDDLLFFESVDGETAGNRISLHFRPEALENADYKELTALLDLEAGRERFIFESGRGRRGSDTISVETRSFAAILRFLSLSVDVPEEDAAFVLPPPEPGAVEGGFSGTGSSALIDIRHGTFASRDEASVAVRYMGRHFIIEHADINSKATLAMLLQLFELVSTQEAGVAPTLTLNVGR
ncbi:MAG: hypothetical protein AAF968_12775 [Pseudomonadota bacterium]